VFALLSSAAVVSGLAGAGAAIMLGGMPFQRSSATARPDSLNGVIPGTLSRPINILILGIDSSSPDGVPAAARKDPLAGNSDTMLLLRVQPSSRQVNVLSIPRDTLVQIPPQGNDKINDANVLGGAALAATTVSRLLKGVPVDRYVRIDTNGLIKFADALGGLDITVPKVMNYEDRTQRLSIHFKPGLQHLSGQRLQEYVRFRNDELGDIGRVQRQQAVLKALLQKLAQPSTIAKLPQLYSMTKQNLDTNLSIEELIAVGHSLSTADRQQINLVMLPGRFSRKDEYKASYWISDPDKTMALVTRYFSPQPAQKS
jgi:LCP family protein required for cell wall assembly